MNKTIVLYVRYKSLYISLICHPLQNNCMKGQSSVSSNVSYSHLQLNAIVAYLAEAQF